MKKIIGLSLVLMILSVAASAQRLGTGPRPYRYDRQVTRTEKVELGRDALRYKRLQRKSQRDGVVTPFERRRLRKVKTECRRDSFRVRHNPRRRLI